MSNMIRPSGSGVTLDDIRRDPRVILPASELAEMGIFRTHRALKRAIDAGLLPPPMKLGLRVRGWQGRAVLAMLGLPVEPAVDTLSDDPTTVVEPAEAVTPAPQH